MSFADKLFVENVRDILDNGYSDAELDVRPHWEDGTKAHTVKKFCIVNRYDLTKEFPIMTLRRTAFKSAIDELLWIWQKKSNNVHDLKSHIWDSWADENGSIGKAYQSYLRPEKQPSIAPDHDKHIRSRRSKRNELISVCIFDDVQRVGRYFELYFEPTFPGYADSEQLERSPIRRVATYDGAGFRIE